MSMEEIAIRMCTTTVSLTQNLLPINKKSM